MSDKITSDAGSTGMNLGDSVYERLLRERTIFLVPRWTMKCEQVVRADFVAVRGGPKPRHFPLHQLPRWLGDCWWAIYDTMKYSPYDVRTYGMGLAASMGTVPAHRGCTRQAFLPCRTRAIMMHQPSAGVGGTAADIAIQAEQFAQTKREMAELIARTPGQTFEQVTKDSDRDRWFTAQQALEYGMVDHSYFRRPRRTVTN